jgi:hypothetical protein
VKGERVKKTVRRAANTTAKERAERNSRYFSEEQSGHGMPCPYEKNKVGWRRSGYMRCITEEGIWELLQKEKQW